MTKKYKCRVEYLESTGTQYIDTGFVPTSDNFQFEIKMLSQSTSAYLGYRSVNSGTATGDMRWFFNYSDGRVAIRYGNTTENSTLSFDTQTTHRFYFNGSSLYVDDVNYLTTTKKYATPVYKSFYLFSVNTSGYYSTDIANFVGRIYYTKIWDNNVLVRDFIPVLDNSGRPAMYDQVSGQLFYNEDSGDDFSYGRQIIPVEYLESTGTQYIDTGVKGKNNIDFDYKCIFTNLDGTAQCVGGNWSGASSSSVSLYLGLIRTNGNFAYHYDGTSSPVVIMNTTVQGTPYSVQGHMWVGEQYMVINGTKSSVGTISSTFTSSLNMYLFGINNNGLSNPAYMKLYYCKIYDNGVLVRDLIPCIDENNTPFMFDKVHNTVYLNAGTGQFKVGPYKADNLNKKLLRKKLALMLTTFEKKRKYYCEVEYLASTDQQNNSRATDNAAWIDTGIVPDDTTKMECRMAFRSLISGRAEEALCGSSGSVTGNYRFAWGFGTISPYTNFYFGLGSQNVTTTVTRDTNVHTFMLDAINKRWVIDGDSGSFTSSESLSNTRSIFLFARHMSYYGDNVANKPANANIYYCRIWKGGILVRDLIPVLDRDMKPCMYDRVTEQLFYSAGTKDFTAGRIGYLESTGTQYIDTGFIGGSNSKVEIKAFSTNNSANMCLFGSRTAERFDYSFSVWQNVGTRMRFDYNAVGVKQVGATAWDITKPNVIIKDKQDNYANGTKLASNAVAEFSCIYPFTIFNTNTGGSPASNVGFAGDVYYCKIWDNDVLVRDLIPAKRIENLAPYTVWEQGTISTSTGAEQDNIYRIRTDFIPIEKIDYYTSTNLRIRNGVVYDENKNFIQASVYPAPYTGIISASNIPNNAKYIRLIYSFQTDIEIDQNDVKADGFAFYSNENELGMWDTVNSGKNLFDYSLSSASWIGTNGAFTSRSASRGIMLPVEQGATYYFTTDWTNITGNSRYTCLAEYDADKVFISGTRRIITSPTNNKEQLSVEVTNPNTKYVGFATYDITPNWWMITKNDSSMVYEPFPFFTNAGTGTFSSGIIVES